jgi:hypothetical protein
MTAIFRDIILEGGRIIGTILSKCGIVRAGACLFSPRSPSCTTIGHSVWCAHLTHRQLPPHTLCQWLRASVRARHRTQAVAPAHLFSCVALVARVLRSSWKCAIKDYHASGFARCACQGVAWVRRSLDTFIPAATLHRACAFIKHTALRRRAVWGYWRIWRGCTWSHSQIGSTTCIDIR